MSVPPTEVIVLGPGLDDQGGITSVIATHVACADAAGLELLTVATTVPGGPLAKASAAIRATARLLGLLVRRPRAVVHAHSSVGVSFYRKSGLLLLASLLRRPTILHVHGSSFDRFLTAGSPLRRAVVRGGLRIPSAIVALSPEWESTLRPFTSRPIHVVPNGVELPSADRDPDPATIVSLGRLGERKGTFDLIAALATLDRPAPRLVLAGDGDVAAARDAAARVDLDDRVEIPGWVDREAAHEILRRATVFALPSYAENLPMALLEAMAAGVPVVASRVGGIPTLIRDGENGLLIDAGDRAQLAAALDRLLSDTELRARIGDAGRRTVIERYSALAATRRLASIYRDLVASPRRG